MSDAYHRLALPARLDLPSAGPLATDLKAHVGKPLTLEATACEAIGTPGLQVLLSAAATWRKSGLPLSLEGLSKECAAQLAIFGLTPDDLCSKEPAL
ncbi:STAS domain-containing protein [Vannielia sp.]|uniref:STAS domain-containing protein n=1 Tax=Vannielia sp. TaxID=2813045 RepID=UPI00260601F7|nr:STAS domain-containing protein [Vannielia sp.]MDF1872059.1 STAS domain-containing protein [Vannielia sp.]